MTAWMEERGVDLASSVVQGDGRAFFAGGSWVPFLGLPRTHFTYAGERADWVSGCAMVVRTALFDRLGGFDPGYFLYSEDVDFSMRAAALGRGTRRLRRAAGQSSRTRQEHQYARFRAQTSHLHDFARTAPAPIFARDRDAERRAVSNAGLAGSQRGVPARLSVASARVSRGIPRRRSRTGRPVKSPSNASAARIRCDCRACRGGGECGVLRCFRRAAVRLLLRSRRQRGRDVDDLQLDARLCRRLGCVRVGRLGRAHALYVRADDGIRHRCADRKDPRRQRVRRD